MTFTLARPGFLGDYYGRPVRAFVAGLTLLAALILLAACANLGSLFAARAPLTDHGRLLSRLALGASRLRILRQLLTEAVLISLVGGAVGLWGSVLLLRGLSAWRPVPQTPSLHVPANPDGRAVYVVGLALALVSGFLFGIVPVRRRLAVAFARSAPPRPPPRARASSFGTPCWCGCAIGSTRSASS